MKKHYFPLNEKHYFVFIGLCQYRGITKWNAFVQGQFNMRFEI